MCDHQSLRSACAYAQSNQSLCLSLEYSMNVKVLTEHFFEFLNLTGGCTGSCESSLVKMPHCLKSHVVAHIVHRQKRIQKTPPARSCVLSTYSSVVRNSFKKQLGPLGPIVSRGRSIPEFRRTPVATFDFPGVGVWIYNVILKINLVSVIFPLTLTKMNHILFVIYQVQLTYS